ncbi:MAG: RNA polymerase sigma factor [Candidatus Pacebacteria bacterium]|jgi:RNA polymerase sigma-70 factor (ECF subfamily)|nr:RNA polymerase sigma factor [Candidatus Paceibacterota bacterium]
MEELNDEDIARRVQGGDIEAFALLAERYEKKITRYAKKFLSQPDDIKDIVQDVFIKAYVNIKSFDAKRKFSPWIYRIAHNEFVNALKKKKAGRISFIDFDVLFPVPVSKEAADGNVERNELRRQLDSCLEKLPVKYREPLVLYYFEEMSYREIAEVMHLPLSTVGIRLQRGKSLLKKIALEKFPETAALAGAGQKI